MTFEQFQASRREVADLQTALGFDHDVTTGMPGFIYADGYYIEKRAPHWPEGSHAYRLCLGNWDDIGDDLERFERKLYEYATPQEGWQH